MKYETSIYHPHKPSIFKPISHQCHDQQHKIEKKTQISHVYPIESAVPHPPIP